MRTLVLPLVLTLLLSCNAYAQKYVIELEGFMFDRQITEVERMRIEERIQDIPSEERSIARTEETMAILRESARELSHFKTTALAGMAEPISQQVDTEAMYLEANFAIVERENDSVTIDCQLACGCVNQQLTHAQRLVNPLTVRLGQREQIGGGGGQVGDVNGKITVAIHQILMLRVREASEEDLKRKKVSDSFEAKLQQKRKPISIPGGKLSMRKAHPANGVVPKNTFQQAALNGF